MCKNDKNGNILSYYQQKKLCCSTPITNHLYIRVLHWLFISHVESHCSRKLNWHHLEKNLLIDDKKPIFYNMKIWKLDFYHSQIHDMKWYSLIVQELKLLKEHCTLFFNSFIWKMNVKFSLRITQIINTYIVVHDTINNLNQYLEHHVLSDFIKHQKGNNTCSIY